MEIVIVLLTFIVIIAFVMFAAGVMDNRDTVQRHKGDLVFVCSPFGGKEENLELARALCREVIIRGATPIAPHLLYPQFLNDGNEHERWMGIDAGKTILRRCDVMLVYTEESYTPEELSECPYVSRGMEEEIALALELDIPITTVDKTFIQKGVV